MAQELGHDGRFYELLHGLAAEGNTFMGNDERRAHDIAVWALGTAPMQAQQLFVLTKAIATALASARTEGERAERARLLAVVGMPVPTGEDSPTCSKCGEFVNVDDGLEWEDGEMCHPCTIAAYDRLVGEIVEPGSTAPTPTETP
jgi:hypothetical protein